MNRKPINILLCLVILIGLQIFVSGNVHAQTDSTSSVYNESVIVVGDYTPVLDGVTEKVNVAPAVNDNITADLQPKFNYSISPRRMSSVTETSGPKTRKVIGSPVRLYNNYMRFGIGHDFAAFADINPLMDLYYTSTRHNNMSYGARLYHQTDVTTFGNEDVDTPSPNHYGRTRMSDTRFDVFAKYILKKSHLLSADLAFDRMYGRYYGFSDSTLQNRLGLNRDSISFSDYAFAYNNLALNLGAKSINTDINKLGYDAAIGMADMWGRYDSKQLSMNLNGGIHYGFPMFSKYKAIAYLNANWHGYRQSYDAPQSTADLPLGYDAATALPDSLEAGRHVLTFNPYVDFLFNGLKFHTGLRLGFNGYDNPESTTHNLFPDLSVAKSFSNNSISLIVGFRGDYHVNDWNTLKNENPFTAPGVDTKATVENDLYAHLRINFSKKLMLNVLVDNNFYRNKMYFALDRRYLLQNVYTPYFVDHNELKVGADFTFVNDEMITMTLGGVYSADYNVPDNMILLFSNEFEAHLDADVNYKDKWFFTLQTLFLSACDAEYATNPATGINEVTATLPARFGLSFEVEYVHNRALSFFAKFDNVTFQRYWLWANYPAPRFNAMVGLTYTIPTK